MSSSDQMLLLQHIIKQSRLDLPFVTNIFCSLIELNEAFTQFHHHFPSLIQISNLPFYQIRYLVFEDCIINKISGPASSSGILTLSHKELHTWNGLLMSNVTVDTVESKAFNLTHMVSLKSLKKLISFLLYENCRVSKNI